MVTNYLPDLKEISSVTKGYLTLVQTSENHDFSVGNSVYFIIPKEFDMIELDNKSGVITAITSDTITVKIDSRRFTPFVSAVSYTTPAQVLPLGDRNFGFQGPVSNDPQGIPGAFRVTET